MIKNSQSSPSETHNVTVLDRSPSFMEPADSEPKSKTKGLTGEIKRFFRNFFARHSAKVAPLIIQVEDIKMSEGEASLSDIKGCVAQLAKDNKETTAMAADIPKEIKTTAELQEEEKDQSVCKAEEDKSLSEAEKDQSLSEAEEDKSLCAPEEDKSLCEPEEDKSLSKAEKDQSLSKAEKDKSLCEPEEDKSLSKAEEDQSLCEPEEDQSLCELEEDKSLCEPEEDQSLSEPEEDQSLSKPEEDQSLSEAEENQSLSEAEEDQSLNEAEEDQSLNEAEEDQSEEIYMRRTADCEDPDVSHTPIGILTIIPEDRQASTDSLHLQSSSTAIILEGSLVMNDLGNLPHAMCSLDLFIL